jgi:protein TonB
VDQLAFEGVRADRLRAVGLSFGLSVGIHVVVVMLLVASFSRVARQAPLVVQRVKLVYVDPAPAAAAPKGAPEGTAKIAPPPVEPPKPIEAPKPAVKPAVQSKTDPMRVLAKKKAEPKPPPATAPNPAEAPPEPVAAIPPPAEIPAGTASGIAGATGDTAGGTADGVVGGRVGGSGRDVHRLGDVATAPVLVTRVVPEYPRRARLAGIEGEVVLEVVVDRYGRVTADIRVVSAVPELERAAVAAVQRWRFKPARDRQGTAVAVVMEVPVRFVLNEATADAR